MIILHCEAQRLNSGKINPKNYPWFKELINELKEFNFIQIGVDGDTQYTEDFRKGLSFKEIKELTKQCKSWIAVDSFYQHLAWELKRPGMCIFGYSDPEIFGHTENLNIVKKNYLRKEQFLTWEETNYNEKVFQDPLILVNKFRTFMKGD
jgi:ADP-heptose:LPS heptosyltransferase